MWMAAGVVTGRVPTAVSLASTLQRARPGSDSGTAAAMPRLLAGGEDGTAGFRGWRAPDGNTAGRPARVDDDERRGERERRAPSSEVSTAAEEPARRGRSAGPAS